MAEVSEKLSPLKKLSQGVKWFFTKDESSFSDKSTIHWMRIGVVTGVFLVGFVILVIAFGHEPQKVSDFSEKKQGSAPLPAVNPNPAKNSPNFSSGVGGSYSGNSQTGTVNGLQNRNTPMILARDGDTSNQLPPGTKFQVILSDNSTITSLSQPVIGLVTQDVVTEYGVAIPRETKIFGQASFDKDSSRANVTWRTIILSNGRSKSMSGIALGSNNQPGIEGDVHSDAVKNTIGSLVTRFAAGVADGSVSKNYFGQSEGGIQNGLLTGVADTAHERADSWSEDLKKERAWIELKKGTASQVILIEGFTYREPGGIQ